MRRYWILPPSSQSLKTGATQACFPTRKVVVMVLPPWLDGWTAHYSPQWQQVLIILYEATTEWVSHQETPCYHRQHGVGHSVCLQWCQISGAAQRTDYKQGHIRERVSVHSGIFLKHPTASPCLLINTLLYFNSIEKPLEQLTECYRLQSLVDCKTLRMWSAAC